MKDFRLYPEGDALADSPHEEDELDEPTVAYPVPDPFDAPTGVFAAMSDDDDPPTEIFPAPESGIGQVSTRRRPVIDEPTHPGRPSVMSPESQRRRDLMRAEAASEPEPPSEYVPYTPSASDPRPPFIDPDATEVNPVAVQPRARRPAASPRRAGAGHDQRPPAKPVRPELLSRATVMDLTPPETGLPFEESKPDTLRSSSVESRPKPQIKRQGKTKDAGDAKGSSAKQFIRRAWQDASPVQRILLFLVPIAGAALIVSGPEALGFGATETTETTETTVTSEAGGTRALAPPAPAPRVSEPAPRHAAPSVAVPPPPAPPVPPVAARQQEPPARGSAVPAVPAGATTPERAAVDALVSGNRALARDRYAELARTQPESPVFAAAARALAEP